MKVLMTIPVKIGFDGMTKQILSYSKYMDKTDVSIDLVSCRGLDEKIERQLKEADFAHVYRMEYRDTNQFKYFINLVKLMKKNKYDIIHTNGQSATLAVELLAAKISGCRVRIVHAHSSQCKHIKIHNILKPLFMALYTDAIACSKKAGDWLFSGEKYWILNNGVDVKLFQFNNEKRNEYRNILKLEKGEVAIGNVAAFEPWKNHKFLIEVFDGLHKIDKKYKLFLFGIDGSTKEDILKMIDEKKLQNVVIYMGTTDHIQDYIQAMDVMVLPSLYEGFPVTAVEWQASGVKCILSDTITKDTDIFGMVDFAPIDKGIQPWIEKLKNIDNDYIEERMNINTSEIFAKEGFDIRKNAEDLKSFYYRAIQKNRKRK